MAPLDSYTIQLKNLHKRYKLSQSILNLFRALDDHRSGSDPEALGRLMRMSPGKRKACTDTIAQLARVMQKKQEPSTVAECTEIIQNCAELLALASESIISWSHARRKETSTYSFPLSPPQIAYWLSIHRSLLHPDRFISLSTGPASRLT